MGVRFLLGALGYGGYGVAATLLFVEEPSPVRIRLATQFIMFGFLNKRISTVAGIIILVLIAASFGAMVLYQWYQIMTLRYQAIEMIE